MCAYILYAFLHIPHQLSSVLLLSVLDIFSSVCGQLNVIMVTSVILVGTI